MGEKSNKENFLFNVNWGMGTKIDSEIEKAMREIHELRNRKNYEFGVTMQLLNHLKETFLGEYINGKYSSISIEGEKLNVIDLEGWSDWSDIGSDKGLKLIESIISEYPQFLKRKSSTFYELNNEFIKLGLDNTVDKPYLSLYLGSLNNINEEFQNRKPTISEGIDD